MRVKGVRWILAVFVLMHKHGRRTEEVCCIAINLKKANVIKCQIVAMFLFLAVDMGIILNALHVSMTNTVFTVESLLSLKMARLI